MKELFTDLYKKVLGFFQTQERSEATENAKTVAVNRMKLVLMQDRTNLTPFLLEKMRGEMVAVLAKYVEMDQEALELNFEQEGDQMALMLSIPVIRAKDEEEIQAILDEEAKAKEEAESEEDSNEESEEELTGETAEEETEETDEDAVEENAKEEVPACDWVEKECNEAAESPDEIVEEEIEEDASSKKSKKK